MDIFCSKGETLVSGLCECDLELEPFEGVKFWSQQGETLTTKGQGKTGRYMMGNHRVRRKTVSKTVMAQELSL